MTSFTRPSLFGSSLQVPQQNQQSNPSLFGSSFANNPQQQGSTFNPVALQSQQQAQQQSTNTFGQPSQTQPSMFSAVGAISQTQPFSSALQQPDILQQRPPYALWQPGSTINPREKTVPEQMQILLEKWSPDSNHCLIQHYFYNNVQADHVPYYGPAPGEDEAKWEEALSKKPDAGSIPVLCRGFSALGNRLRVQVQSATSLQARLHEINNSLTAMLQNHDLNISVRTINARRKHVTLSQRCLQLATKVQILRNRGYAMDAPEEELRRKLVELERSAFDLQLNSRQEEIWARMVAIRERIQFLQEEAERSGDSTAKGASDLFDEDTKTHTKKILNDYDSQISYIQREIEKTRKDFEDWEHSRTL